MSLLPILVAPDPRLRKPALPVDKADDEIRTLMHDMLETMYHADGIGLAAPQVGVSKRVIVMDVAKERQENAPFMMANPEIIAASDTLNVHEEGCLSLPEHYGEVERPQTVRVRWLDLQNEIREQEMDGLLATCVQHEIDHLNGVLFVNHLSSVRRSLILKKLTKTKQRQHL